MAESKSEIKRLEHKLEACRKVLLEHCTERGMLDMPID